jgi:hypothetical protein
MMLQYRLSSRKIRLQAQEFVAFRRLNQARLRNLARPFVPDLQRVLTLFEQPLGFLFLDCNFYKPAAIPCVTLPTPWP